MNIRRQRGAALSLVAAAFLVIIMIGTAFFVLSLFMGGSRELLHATDAGSLNVAKQAIRKPDVSLQQTEETLNFQGLLDKGDVSLANYNRVVGQTFLVALNAQAEGTPAARANAEKLIDVLEGSNGIGARLTAALKNPQNMEDHFSNLTLVNSVRMLGASAIAQSDNDKHEVAYLEEGSASNVHMDAQTLPYSTDNGMIRVTLPAGSTVSEKSKNFITGYAPIQVPGLSKKITGVPVMPFKAPHLVSRKDFDAKPQAPKGAGQVPPNSFKSGGKASTSRGIACSIVGALETNFTAAIPRGYMVIHNGSAATFSGELGGNDHIFAQELDAGIFVGPGTGSARAFTTDSALYEQWLHYNTAKAAGISPIPSEPSKIGMHGNPYSITSPSTKITWLDYGEHPTPTAAAILSSFQTGYPHTNATTSFQSNSLTALELFKAQVIQAFGRVTRLHDPTDPAFRQVIPAPSLVTGMKAFDHNGVYAANPGNVGFGRAGSLREFLNQCNASSVLMQIEQRLHQIKPEAKQSEINAVLDSTKIGMGQNLYIYKGLADNKLCISNAAFPWITNVSPDGRTQTLSQQYDILRKTVNAAGDGGAPVYPFMYSDPAAAIDSVSFTPSSGYRNLLAEMNFSNRTVTLAGSGAFWDPN